MLPIESYFRKERKRLEFYTGLDVVFRSSFIFLLVYQVGLFLKPIAVGFTKTNEISHLVPSIFLSLAGLFIAFYLFKLFFRSKKIKLSDVGRAIEAQSEFFEERLEHKTEIQIVGSFLESTVDEYSKEFQEAHIKKWDERLADFAMTLIPSRRIFFEAILVAVLIGSTAYFQKTIALGIPTRVMAWSPTNFELLLPYQGAEWQYRSGALAGIRG